MNPAEFIFAGFGGQGVMSMGMAIAYAAMYEGKQVSWLPSYGPEQRGGTANCMVVVSDQPVGSPLVTEPDCAVTMTLPSLEKFGPAVKPGGLLFINRSLVSGGAGREDVRVFALDVLQLAKDMGDSRVANMIMLGAVIAATGVVSLAAAAGALDRVLPERHHHLLELDREALVCGAALAAEAEARGPAT